MLCVGSGHSAHFLSPESSNSNSQTGNETKRRCVFNTYVLPVLDYCLPIWLPALRPSSEMKLNSLFTKFLKRYLGVPYICNNAVTHHICGTIPLSHILKSRVEKLFLGLRLPSSLSGVRMTPPVVSVPDGGIPCLRVCSYIFLDFGCPLFFFYVPSTGSSGTPKSDLVRCNWPPSRSHLSETRLPLAST